MQPTFTVDLTGFQRAMRQYLLLTSKSIPEACNHVMKDVLIRAYNLTPRADPNKIESDLRRLVYVAGRTLKSGKIKLKKQNKPRPVAYLIVQGERKRLGLPPIPKDQVLAAANKMIANRKKSCGSLKAGWRGALMAFGEKDTKMVKVKQKGSGTPAVPSFNAAALAKYNLTLVKNHTKTGQVDPRVEGALATAFQSKERDIEGYIATENTLNMRKAGF